MLPGKKRIVSNFMSLSFQQGITIIFPLLLFPYLLRVLGLAGFGVFTLIQTGIMYFDLLIAFGFSLTATQRIAKTYGNTTDQAKIAAAVYTIKLLLFVVAWQRYCFVLFLSLTCSSTWAWYCWGLCICWAILFFRIGIFQAFSK